MPLTGKPKGFTTSFQNHRLMTEFQSDQIAIPSLVQIAICMEYQQLLFFQG